MTTMQTTRSASGMILEERTEYGYAARNNRGKFAGQKVHRLRCEYVVGLEAGCSVRPGTFAAIYATTGKPVLFSCYPACGCTQGQMAGKPREGFTAENVTCEKCK